MKHTQLLSTSLALLLGSASSTYAATIALQNPNLEFNVSGIAFAAKTDQYGDGGPDINTVGLQGFTFIRLAGSDIGIEQTPGLNGTDPDGNGFAANLYISNAYVEQVTTVLVAEGTYVLSLGKFTNNPELQLIARGAVDTILASGFGNSITANVTANFGETLVFRLGSPDGTYRILDDVGLDFTAAVPETSTALCALLGGSLFIARRRRVAASA